MTTLTSAAPMDGTFGATIGAPIGSDTALVFKPLNISLPDGTENVLSACGASGAATGAATVAGAGSSKSKNW